MIDWREELEKIINKRGRGKKLPTSFDEVCLELVDFMESKGILIRYDDLEGISKEELAEISTIIKEKLEEKNG